MMSRRFVLMIITIWALLLTACNEETPKLNQPEEEPKASQIEEGEDVKVVEYTVLTREYLLETYGITEEDLEGIEFDLIVKEELLGENSFKKDGTKERVLNSFKKDQEALEEERRKVANDKTYILEAPVYDGEIPDLSELKYFSLEVDSTTDDTEKFAHFINFENDTYYRSDIGSIVEDYISAYIQKELSDDQIEDFINGLKDLSIDQWNQNQKYGSNPPFWDIGLEFSNGLVISFHGGRNEDRVYPEDYQKLIEMLQAIGK